MTIPRTHLLQELGRTVSQLPRLTVLSAPLGYGKSILLSKWQDHLSGNIRTSRVSAKGLAGAGDLWRKLAQELAVGEESAAGAAGRGRLGSAADRAVGRLLSATTAPTLLVIDDYEDATSPELDEALLRLLETNPNLYLAVSGRRFSLLDTPMAYLRVLTRILRSEDLTFSEDEVLQLARRLGAPAGSTDQKMVSLLRGWPLATRLALENTRGDEGYKPDLEALNEVVLQTVTDPSARRVLSLTTYLSGVSQEFLEAVCGVSPGSLTPIMLGLEEQGLVQESRGGTHPRYWAHPVIRDYPVWVQNQELNGEQLRSIRMEFAAHIAQDRPVQALEILLRVGAFVEAEEHALRSFPKLMISSESTVDALRPLSGEVLSRHPGLLGLRMVIDKTSPEGDPARLTRWARSLVKGTLEDAEGDPENVRSSYLILSIIALRIAGEWEESLRISRYLELRLAENSHNQYGGDWRGLSLGYFAICVTGILGGSKGLALRAAAQGLRIAAEHNSEVEQIRAYRGIAFLEGMRGKLGPAREALEQIDNLGPAQVNEVFDSSWELEQLGRAVIALQTGALSAAEGYLASLKPHLGSMEQWTYFIALEAWVERANRGASEAYDCLRLRTEEIQGRSVSLRRRASLTALLANLAMYSQQTQAAAEILDCYLPPVPRLQLARARLALLQNDHLLAISIIDELCQTDGQSSTMPERLLLGAAVYYGAGDHESAQRMVDELEALDLEVSVVVGAWSTVPYDHLRGLASMPGASDKRIFEGLLHLGERLRFNYVQPLTPSESRILNGIAQYKTVGATADALYLSTNTVKTHVRSIYAKLGVARRQDALSVAQGLGWLKLEVEGA